MVRKRYSDEDVLKILNGIDVYLHDVLDVVNSCRTAPIPTPLCKKGKAYPAPRSGRLAWFLTGTPTPTVSFPHRP